MIAKTFFTDLSYRNVYFFFNSNAALKKIKNKNL